MTTEYTVRPDTYKGKALKIVSKADERLTSLQVLARMDEKPDGGVAQQLYELNNRGLLTREKLMDEQGQPYAYETTDDGDAVVNVEYNTTGTATPDNQDAGGLSQLFDNGDDDGANVSQTSEHDPRPDMKAEGDREDVSDAPGVEAVRQERDMSELEDKLDELHDRVDDIETVYQLVKELQDAVDDKNVYAIPDDDLSDIIVAVAQSDNLNSSRKRNLVGCLSGGSNYSVPPLHKLTRAVGVSKDERSGIEQVEANGTDD